MPTKTKTSFYRRLLITHLIDCGCDTIPKIQQEIKIPRRTAQDTINALYELDIKCIFVGASKNGHYLIKDWGPIDKVWVVDHLEQIKQTLDYK